MDFYIVTRKAELTQKLKEIYKTKIEQLSKLEKYFKKLKNISFDDNEIELSCSSILINIISNYSAVFFKKLKKNHKTSINCFKTMLHNNNEAEEARIVSRLYRRST